MIQGAEERETERGGKQLSLQFDCSPSRDGFPFPPLSPFSLVPSPSPSPSPPPLPPTRHTHTRTHTRTPSRLLTNLYNGTICIWHTGDGSLVRSFEASDLPVRAAKFVARKQWVVSGADDAHVRVHNYNTLAKERAFEAHADYIRAVAVHPTQPLLLTAGDDMLIKAWDWERGWSCAQVFEGHSHYVMAVCFNPKDANTFASASLDR